MSSSLPSPSGSPAQILGLKISPADRTPFASLTALLAAYLSDLCDETDLEDLYLFRLLNLVNPVTSYLRSPFHPPLNLVLRLPAPLYPLGLLSTLPFFVDAYQPVSLLQMVLSIALPNVINTEAREAYMERLAIGLGGQIEVMDRDTLEFREREYLTNDAEAVGSMLQGLEGSGAVSDVPGSLLSSLPGCLFVSGSPDGCLPSVSECVRLEGFVGRLGGRCVAYVVEGAGYGGTMGGRVDMGRVMREAVDGMEKDKGEGGGASGRRKGRGRTRA